MRGYGPASSRGRTARHGWEPETLSAPGGGPRRLILERSVYQPPDRLGSARQVGLPPSPLVDLGPLLRGQAQFKAGQLLFHAGISNRRQVHQFC